MTEQSNPTPTEVEQAIFDVLMVADERNVENLAYAHYVEAIIAAGYLSPAEVAERERAAAEKGWDIAIDVAYTRLDRMIGEQHVIDLNALITKPINPYRKSDPTEVSHE